MNILTLAKQHQHLQLCGTLPPALLPRGIEPVEDINNSVVLGTTQFGVTPEKKLIEQNCKLLCSV